MKKNPNLRLQIRYAMMHGPLKELPDRVEMAVLNWLREILKGKSSVSDVRRAAGIKRCQGPITRNLR
jgi:hypothetical protein